MKIELKQIKIQPENEYLRSLSALCCKVRLIGNVLMIIFIGHVHVLFQKYAVLLFCY